MTDIEGSTKIWSASPRSAKQALNRHDRIAIEQVEKNQGQVIETGREGDSILAVFRQASDAVACALETQRALQREVWPAGFEVQVRIAVHTGEAELTSGHYVGAPLYRCARLMATAHGGQTLISNATQELVADNLPAGVDLVDLGQHRLRDLVRPEHVYQLKHAELPHKFPPLKSLEPERTNLPEQLTSFVGRKAELGTVKRLISESRLVTLTGAGGIGKTRLALEVARQAVDQYRDGVWLVELAPLGNLDLVPNVMLAALGFGAQQSDSPTESLINALKVREMLCVLDNCEHLLDACARLADALLRSCPLLRILATSRELLGVSGETTWRVPSMATPATIAPPSLEDLQSLETVQLFVQRGDKARPGFQLTSGNAGAVARICRRLDGIPLAIELAAARVRTLPISAIDQRLDDRFHLLTGGSRVSLPRQRTLRATLDWSHDLLDGREQTLFGRLAVFRGGFTLEAAEGICTNGESDVGAVDSVLEVLSSLVDKSLVMLEEGADHPARYSLLETVREYGHDRLRLAGGLEQTARRHALYFLTLGDEIYKHLHGPEQAIWFTYVEDELDNLRACFEWALEHDPRSALQLTLAVERYWQHYRHPEGHDWLTRSLAAAPEPSLFRARALYSASFRATFEGSFEEARQLGNECLTLSRDLGNGLWQGKALIALAIAWGYERRDGWSALSFPLFEEAEALVRQSSDTEALAELLNDYGWALHAAGENETARSKLEEALILARQLDDAWLIAPFQGSLAGVEFASGDRDRAQAGWRHELELAGQIGAFMSASEALTGLARLALADRQLQRCLQLLAAAVEFFRRTASVVDPPDPDFVREAQGRAQQLIGAEGAEATWREGARMSLAEAVRFGLGEPLQAESVTLPTALATSAAGPTAVNAFVREGEFWSIGFAGRVVRLKDSKGLQDIARLLVSPGTEVAAIDLARGPVVKTQTASSRMVAEAGLGVEADAGPVLDAEARQLYRSRLRELEKAIGDAESNNDPERASRAREKREFLLPELGAAVGLGGRGRGALDPAERARKTVQWRIQDAISRIEAGHPELGRHFRRSVRTGMFCVYDPPEPTAWELNKEPAGRP